MKKIAMMMMMMISRPSLCSCPTTSRVRIAFDCLIDSFLTEFFHFFKPFSRFMRLSIFPHLPSCCVKVESSVWALMNISMRILNWFPVRYIFALILILFFISNIFPSRSIFKLSRFCITPASVMQTELISDLKCSVAMSWWQYFVDEGRGYVTSRS